MATFEFIIVMYRKIKWRGIQYLIFSRNVLQQWFKFWKLSKRNNLQLVP